MQIILVSVAIVLDGKTNVYWDGRYLTIRWTYSFFNITVREVFTIRLIFF